MGKHVNEHNHALTKQQLKEEEQKKAAQYHRRAKCKRLLTKICKYYKEKKNFNEWHACVALKNKPELTMEDCYTIELTSEVVDAQILNPEFTGLTRINFRDWLNKLY